MTTTDIFFITRNTDRRKTITWHVNPYCLASANTVPLAMEPQDDQHVEHGYNPLPQSVQIDPSCAHQIVGKNVK